MIIVSLHTYKTKMNKFKKILIIPALFDHIDLIKEAKKAGFQIITCDNNPDNEGHKYSDVFKNISLLDIDSVVNMAKDEKIDAVSPFSTDIGAIPAAYIAQEMNIVGNPVNTVTIMSNKYSFRKFLSENNFNVPKFQSLSSFEEIDFDRITFPLIIKPTDRAGSKGVYVVEDSNQLKDKFNKSRATSFEKKIILEDYIETEYMQLQGDAIVQDGKLLFSCIGNQHFGKGNMSHSPIATTFPTTIPPKVTNKIIDEISRFINLAGYKNGGINIEIRVDKNENIYFIELAPRFGGNFIAKTIGLVCNINIIEYAFKIAIGKKIKIPDYKINPNIFQFILRTQKQGIFQSVEVKKNSPLQILDSFSVKKPGNYVDLKSGPSSIIAVYIIKVEQRLEIVNIINNPEIYFNIKLTPIFNT